MFCSQCGTDCRDGSKFCEKCGEPFSGANGPKKDRDRRLAPVSDSLDESTEFGDYKILSELGDGGMGRVYRARHKLLDNEVAIKVLASRFARNKKLMERFKNEARIQATLRHTNIVRVIGFIAEAGVSAIVMDLVKGHSLAEIIHEQSGPMMPNRCLALMGPILEAVDYAHSHGVLHRDLKPANIMVEKVGGKEVPLVTDFGIAKILHEASHTITGTELGTPYYMSPEQCKGAKDVDARADIYSLGVTLFEMAAGRVPFLSESDLELYKMHTQDPPPPPRSIYPGVPEALEQVILTAMAKHPDDRYQTADDFLAALRRALGAEPKPAPDRTVVEMPDPDRQPSASEVMEAERLTGVAIKQEQEGHLDQALNTLERALALNPHSRSAREVMDRINMALTTARVHELCNEAFSLLQGGVDEVEGAFDACSQAREVAAGAEELEACARGTGEQLARMLYDHGEAFYREGEIEKAVKAMEELQRRDPQNEQATPWLEKFEEDLSSRGPSGLEMLRATQLKKAGRLAEAEAAVREALVLGEPAERALPLLEQIQQEWLEAALEQAGELLELGRLAKAQSLVAKAIDARLPGDRLKKLREEILAAQKKAFLEQAAELVESGHVEQARKVAQELGLPADVSRTVLERLQKQRHKIILDQVDELIATGNLDEAMKRVGQLRRHGVPLNELEPRVRAVEAELTVRTQVDFESARQKTKKDNTKFVFITFAAVVGLLLLIAVVQKACAG